MTFWKVTFAPLYSLMCMKPGLKAQSLKPNGRKSDFYLPSFLGNTLRRFIVIINVKKKGRKGEKERKKKGWIFHMVCCLDIWLKVFLKTLDLKR